MTVRLLQLTDLHVFSDPLARLKGVPTRDSLQDVLQLIRDRGEAFDHLVITGDHTHDELETTYRLIREMLGDWVSRLHHVPGNHDDRDVIRSVFGDVVPTSLPFIPFSFPAGGWQFVGLDTHIPGEVPGRIEESQLDWFAAELAAAGDRSVGLFMHHPPISVNSVWMDAIGLQEPERLVAMIEEHPAIRFVCCGHVHHEFRGSVGDTAVYTTPSTGVQFNPQAEEPTTALEPPGYRIIECDEKSFHTEVVRLPEVRYPPEG